MYYEYALQSRRNLPWSPYVQLKYLIHLHSDHSSRLAIFPCVFCCVKSQFGRGWDFLRFWPNSFRSDSCYDGVVDLWRLVDRYYNSVQITILVVKRKLNSFKCYLIDIQKLPLCMSICQGRLSRVVLISMIFPYDLRYTPSKAWSWSSLAILIQLVIMI